MAFNKKNIKVRRWQENDIPSIVECHKAVYRDFPEGSLSNARTFQLQFNAFPEGQFLAELEGKVIGYAASIIVQLDDEHPYTYNELTGGASFSTHNPSGDTLYGADIGVNPDYRGHGIAGMLYVQRKKLMKRYNLMRMVAYGRIPGYRKHAGEYSPEEYVEEVVAGNIKDLALNAHLKAGYKVKKILPDFFQDASSANYSTWIEHLNTDFRPEKRKISGAPLKHPVRKIRVCAAQYMMRKVNSWEDFEQNVEFFVDTADCYNCHFLMFPELFTAQLFSMFPPEMDGPAAMRRLAEMTDRYTQMFIEKAKEHRLYIIGGSQPVIRDGKIYNVAHLFTPNGNVYTQDKLHITPAERKFWDIHPGKSVKIFDTPFGKIAILVCYDIEFPELSRLLCLSGVEVIFVPFSTDERKSYNRVRITAHARAVENYIYVVIAGNVGNLPNVKSYLLNYGQAAVLTPSDFAFPLNAIEGEANPNIETVVIAELDLNSLSLQREIGSVRPWFDRRPDLYELNPKIPFELERID
ncbi:MAG: GNAT family N-acetyltransferase [SAR324 cluster bacterium]|nr:GNAT family N-acetyltransferase [SAR324 cluster bacterium]